MILSASARGMALPILCLAAFACGKPAEKSNAADPNAPAVVKVPPPILPGDTAKKEVPPVVDERTAQLTVNKDYALLGASFAFKDRRLVSDAYDSAAVLVTPNGTFTGTAAIVKEYASFGMDGSVQEFRRQSIRQKIVDSTVVDSGTYVVLRKSRTGGAPTAEHGAYASVWKIKAPPAEWVMTRDHLYPAKPGAK